MVAAYRYDATGDFANRNTNEWGIYLVRCQPWYCRQQGHGGNNTADVTFIGESRRSPAQSAAGAGDFNCDGNMDIILGSQYADYGGNDAGVAWRCQRNLSGTVTLSGSGSILAKLTGENASDNGTLGGISWEHDKDGSACR